MALTIPLTRGKYTLVDPDDYPWLSQFRWYYHKHGYAARTITINGKRVTLPMHRAILNAPPDKLVDHINGDPLNNRRANLRLVTALENARNRRAQANVTGYKGVRAHRGRFQARISVCGRRIHLGYYDLAISAAMIYDHAARRFFGPYARLNFPDMPEMLGYKQKLDAVLNGEIPRYRPQFPPKAPKAKSRFKGVYWERGRWRAVRYEKGRKIHLGYFTSEEEAARVVARAQS